MEADKVREKDLVLALKKAKEKKKLCKQALEIAEKEYAEQESKMLAFLDLHSSVSTARYEGLGWATRPKDRLRASFRKEDFEELCVFLTEQQREDLIKTSVLPQSLATFVKECILEGVELPECIKYCFIPSIRLYNKEA